MTEQVNKQGSLDEDPFGLKWALFGPFEGPANYDTQFNIPENLAQDWIWRPIEPGVALLPHQLNLMKSSLLKSVRFHTELGSGSFGKVYEIEAIALVWDRPQIWKRNHFACKVMRPTTQEFFDVSATLRDMHILRYLKHENICNIIDIMGIPDIKTGFPFSVVCLVTKLCDTDLELIVNELKGPEWEPHDVFNRHWFAQTALGLAYIHSKDIKHDDIKAANIFIRFTNRTLNSLEHRFMSSVVKLGDFGVSINLINSRPDEVTNFQSGDIYKLGATLREYQYYSDSDQLEDLINQMIGDEPPTAQQVLTHPWLQENTDPRTEPYIYRTTRFQKSIFDPLTQKWKRDQNTLIII